ncbi:MAG: transporter substrate-binding domain-containing protein [Bifidobacteriaceae bacterium]|jgi:polar amino acid transport system substrate-binding protein|nr:transporter substrate-binding domain-containing protein [Bifidobacteriaceae bacterium]
MPSKSAKALSTAALVISSAFATAACGTEDNGAASPSSSAPVVQAGQLTVCISKNAYPPLYWNEGGKLQGFEVDSLEKIAGELDLKLVFTEVAFDGLLPGLAAGRCDIMRSGLYINEERTATFDAIPYLMTGPALIVPPGNPKGIETVEDLAGLRVAAQGASANETKIKEVSDQLAEAGLEPVEISVYPEMPETIAALQNGRVDGTIETDVAAVQAAQTLGEGWLALDELFDAGTEFGMYFAKDSALLPQVREAARKLTEEGVFGEIAVKHGLNPDRVVMP